MNVAVVGLALLSFLSLSTLNPQPFNNGSRGGLTTSSVKKCTCSSDCLLALLALELASLSL